MSFYMEADVVVCGAGTAGTAAALAAADTGARVLLIEQFGSAGGSSTLGLVEPLMSNHIAGRPSGSYIADEIARRMLKEGAASKDGKSYFDPLMLSMVLEEMLLERSVTVLYHTSIIGAEKDKDAIRCLQVHNKSGRGQISARCKYIDATGDADVAALAGLPFMQGDSETHTNQPCSLRYMVGGVNIEAFWRYVAGCRGVQAEEHAQPAQWSDAVTNTKEWALSPVFREAIKKGDLEEDDAVYWQFFTVPGRGDSIAFNCPEFFDVPDCTDALALSRVQMRGKQSILRQLRFYRRYFPGFENAYVSAVASMVGVRESRRAITEYILTTEDALQHRKFEDAIACSNYPVDVHGRQLRNEQIKVGEQEEEPYYEIPLRSLIVKDVNNLLVAGRSLGASFEAQASARIIPTCRAMGEAAGIAAALNTTDGLRVRAEMEARRNGKGTSCIDYSL